MKEYLIAYIGPSNNGPKYGNTVIIAFSKRGAINTFKVDSKAVILNIIELD